jgi:TetR/AcrR family transcriptional regulator, transcriptional repressor for nem operon
MRYSKSHKQETKRRITVSAYRLFTAKGFEHTSIEEIMRDCNLTRGGFYAHFRSKSALYREALKLSVARPTLHASKKGDWVDAMLDEYLNAEISCDANDRNRFAFFVADVASENPDVRTAYSNAFKTMSDKISGHMAGQFGCGEEAILSIAAMMIGAAAVARSIDDGAFKTKFLTACKTTARALIENKNILAPPTFFWERAAYKT